MSWIHDLSQTILHFFMTYPLRTIFVLILFEEAGIPLPLPGDTLLILAGTQSPAEAFFGLRVVLTASLAVFCGSSALFLFVRAQGRPFLAKYGRYIGLSHERLDRVEGWFIKRGPAAIVVGRLIPGLRIPTTVMAGLSGMTYRQFIAPLAIAAVIWSSIFFWLGRLAHIGWPYVVAQVSEILDVIPKELIIAALVSIGGVILIGGLHRVQRFFAERKAPTDEQN